jgi:hypothetical protein
MGRSVGMSDHAADILAHDVDLVLDAYRVVSR